MAKNKITHWPDEVRLKMIEKSDTFYNDGGYYKFGYYDGFQEAVNYFREVVPNFDQIIKELED